MALPPTDISRKMRKTIMNELSAELAEPGSGAQVSADNVLDGETRVSMTVGERDALEEGMVRLEDIRLTPVGPDDDDDIAPTTGLPIAMAFAEKITGKARAFLMRDGGFGGKVFTFLFGGNQQDDDHAPIWGLMLGDGKMPLQADADWRFYLKLQDRAVAYIRDRLAAMAALLWRGPAGIEDLRLSPKLMRAAISDVTVIPAWYGEVSLPVAGTSVAATPTGGMQFDSSYGQSTAGAAGVQSSQLTSIVGPYHCFRFSAGSAGSDTVDTILAALNDITPVADSQLPRIGVALGQARMFMGRVTGRGTDRFSLYREDNKGGAPITDIIKGGASKVYSNMMTSWEGAYLLSIARGVRLSVTVHVNHGETSGSTKDDGTVSGMSVATYQGHVAATIDNINTDCQIKAKQLPLILDSQTIGQTATSGWWLDNFNGPFARLIEVRLRRGGNLINVGPRYDMPCGDTIHPLAEGQMIDGPRRVLAEQRWRDCNPLPMFDVARLSVPALFVGDEVRASGVTEATAIQSQVSGTAGGVGIYTVNQSQLVARRKMHAFGAIFWGSISNGAGAAGTTLVVDEIEEGALDMSVTGAELHIGLTMPASISSWVPTVGPALGVRFADSIGTTALSTEVRGSRLIVHLSQAPGTGRIVGHADVHCAEPYVRNSAVACTASFADTVMTVTAAAAATIAVGDPVSAQDIKPWTTIVEQLTGTPGGVGTYRTSTPNTLTSRPTTIRWNWSAARSTIMHDTGVANPFAQRGYRVPRTICFGLPRFRHLIP
jgi:hypothetical protein